MLAGHAALSTTQRYIEADVEAEEGRGPDLTVPLIAVRSRT